MAHISVKNLSVDIPIYGADARSIKTEILSLSVGGAIRKDSRGVSSIRAIDDISIEISDGSRIGLVGHNGAGKSTFLRAMSGIYYPTAGSIEITGKVGVLIDPFAGMIHEETGLENIRLKGIALGISKKEINNMIDDVIEFSELHEYINMPIKTYSAGMLSRLSFSIITSIKPDILLVDEGIGAGDAQFQKKVKLRINDMLKKVSILIIASHSIDFLNSLDCVQVSFEKGKLIR